MNEEIGTVISGLESPSPSSVDFVVTSGVIHRGMFVELDYSEGTMICLVNDVVKTNRYFERAESVKEFESQGKKLFEQFPTEEWEFLIAKTRPLGVFSKKLVKRPSFPPSPGTKVKIADNKHLEQFLGFDLETGLELGKVEYHDLDVKLNLSSLLKKHLAVLALSGGGKSYLMSVLFEELLERNQEQGRIATVVLDPHGEYSSFAEPAEQGKKDFSSKTNLVKAEKVKIGVPKLSIGILSGIIPGLSSAQKRDLGRIISNLNVEMRRGLGAFDLKDVQTAIAGDKDMKENTKIALLGWISHLEELKLFSKADSPSISDLVEPGKLTIIDLSNIINVKKKQIIVSYFAQRLFYDRRKKLLPPFLLVLEEAHQFIPERAGKDTAIAKGIMRTIAREGRKFGASLCLVSQRPIQLDTTALSQCNTKIILRITNPYDLDHVAKSAEALDRRSLDMITSLRVGEALIVGEAVSFPVFFKVREKKSQDSKHEVSLEDAGRRFEESKKQNEEEAKEFL